MDLSHIFKAAAKRRRDRWVFRRGILSQGPRVTIAGRWGAEIRRVLKPGQSPIIDRHGIAWKRSVAGLIVPLHSRLAWSNIVTNAGRDYAADVALSGASQTSTWYVLLMASSPTAAAGDTMSSHGGWTEFTGYSEGTRQTWSDAGVSSGVVTNSASKAVFTSNADSQTVGGAGLTSNSTKSGTSGTLFAGAAFSGGNEALDDTETISVTAQFTFADDGS